MAPARRDQLAELDPAKAIAGVLAVLVAEREERIGDDAGALKTELILSNAGLSAPEIARIMGKNADAVRKTIQRGRK